MTLHAQLAGKFIKDEQRTDWHNHAVYNFRLKRDATAKTIPEWEQLRALASAIKDNVLSNLDTYLLEFETKAKAHGVHVHWACDANEHNQIIHNLLKARGVKRVVKSKSMLTEECGLNEFLEKNHIEVIDTDLGERIIQLRHEPPSHIVAPAIHLKREEVSDLFHRELKTQKGNSDPTYLTRAARHHLREKFLQAEAGITGVNFAVAEAGAVVVVTNEGNADLGCNIPPLQIHSMGLEKIIPRWEHLGVFTRLLAASASGQKISIYTSHYLKPKPGGEMHVVLVDNGRSAQLGKDHFRNSLKCIRCSACMNTCPVYRRSGGYSYHTAIAGPIGSILMPNRNLHAYADLPFASSLCGSCSNVCPVKIDIHDQLYRWRQVITQSGNLSATKKIGMMVAAKILSNPTALARWGKFVSRMINVLPRWLVYSSLNAWGKGRELPKPPAQTFAAWYQQNRKP